MSVKFFRNYILTVDGPAFKTPLQIGLPFTIDFDVSRNSYAGTNHANIRIYNLSAGHRNLLLHDQTSGFIPDPSNILNITLQAGYENNTNVKQWPVVFTGNATRAWSVRQGNDFITTITAFDGGTAFNSAVSNHIFSAGTSMSVVYDTLINDLLPYGVSKGVVSNLVTTGTLSKAQGYSGNTIDLLRELSNSNFFIDNLSANVLTAKDAIGGEEVTINGASGLLGTPYRQQQILYFDILFEPRIVIGSTINLQSINVPFTSTSFTYNGLHKVIEVSHRCLISPTVCGDAVTSLGCAAGVFNELTAKAGF